MTLKRKSASYAFPVPDRVEDKKRGMGAVISMCPVPGQLRENVLEIPPSILEAYTIPPGCICVSAGDDSCFLGHAGRRDRPLVSL